MMEIARRAKVAPSATMTMNSLAIQKKQKGEYVFNFATGDPVVPNHSKVLEAASAFVKKGLSPYPAVAGIPELREAFCQWMNQTYQTSYKSSQCLVTCGGKFALFALAQALLNPGDEALLIAPYWVSYPGIVQLAEGVPVILETSAESGWKVSVEQIEKNLTSKSKFLILNNGCNPTGALYSKEELEAILALCKKSNILLISDEVYSEIVYDGAEYISCGSFTEYLDHLVLVQSCSKNFAMAGWRVGFTLAPEWVIKALTAIQGQSTTGTAIQSQRAALAAVQNGAEVSKYVREAMTIRRDLFLETYKRLFQKTLPKPPSAVYFFLSLSDFGFGHIDSVTFCEKALEKANVALVPGVAFGREGYVRFAFSEKEEDIVKGLEALAKFCQQER